MPKSYFKHIQATFLLAWPIVLNHLGHMVMGLIDSLMVGRLGPVPLAGLAFSLSLYMFCMVIFMGFGSAISVFVATAKAQNRPAEAGRTYRDGLWLHLVFSSLVALFVHFVLMDRLEIFAQTAEVNAAAREYFPILNWSLIPAAIFLASRQFAEGLGFPRLPMLMMYFGLVMNAGLNWLLIFGNAGFPELGLSGAALGTLITRVTMCLSLMIIPYFLVSHRIYLPRSFFRAFKISRFVALCRLGIPSGAQYAFEFAAFGGAALMMGWLGTLSLAAHHIAINLASMTFMLALGTSTAALIRVSHALGQSDIHEARRAGFSAVFLCSGVMVVLGSVFILGREWLPSLYVDELDVIQLASQFLIVAGVFQVFDGTQGVLIGALRGARDVTFPTLITFSIYWLFCLPLGYGLAFIAGWGGIGIWVALAFGLMGSSSLLTWRFWHLTKFKAGGAASATT